MEFMTTSEVSAALQSGFRTVLVPCGAIEQHGAHLPLSVDSDHAEHLGLTLAKALGKSLIAPSIRVGCSVHHLDFPGTISLREPTFESICADYCASLSSHGFENILFFSGHVGNFPALQSMLPRVQSQMPEGCRVDAFTDSGLWLKTWRDAVGDAGGDACRVGGHADIAETSVMLSIHPRRVRTNLYAAGKPGLPSKTDLQAMWLGGIRAVSKNGILGDPNGSSTAIGDLCIERITRMLLDYFSSPR
ncbi:creatininase family protein [Alloalcanivorax sp. C16-1]|uniref:creatininase family protein n=1 Tax=Alloalcanivorax sp. C16-1 TaxID=3390051 RepID=UPI00397111FF